MIVGSSCLDGLTGHRADSAWIKASVERRVKPTGAGTHQLTARRVPGGARPGRWTGVPLRRRRTGTNTPWQLEGQHLTGGRSATVKGSEGRTINVQRVDSQAILSERRGPSEGGLPGSARRAMQGAAAALVDSRTRRILPGGECLCGEPPHLERVDQLRELRLHSERFSQVGRVPRSSRGRLSFSQWTSVCTTNTFVAGEGGRSVRDWASPQSLCDLCLWL